MIYGDYRLHIKVKTSKRLLDCMYDHESNFYNSFVLKTGDFGNLLRVKDQVYYTDGSSSISKNSKKFIPFGEESDTTLARIVSDPEGIQIKYNKRSPDKGFWLTLGRRSNNNKEPLEIGDIFRLGIIKYQVLKVQIQKDIESETDVSIEETIKKMFEDQMKFNEDYVIKDINHGHNPYDLPNIRCRICLMGPLETSQAFINPCKCAGTMGDMHIRCFRQWVINKVDVEKRKKSLKVSWKSLSCELCQTELSTKMGCSDLDIALLNFRGVFTEPYIILKPLNAEEDPNSVLVLELDEKKPFQIGRAFDNDYILSDISVSRSHADLLLIKDKVYIEDKESRFGTLLLRTDPVKLNQYILKSPWFQHGRTIMKFELQKPWVKVFPWLKRFMRSDNMNRQAKITPAVSSEITDRDVNGTKDSAPEPENSIENIEKDLNGTKDITDQNDVKDIQKRKEKSKIKVSRVIEEQENEEDDEGAIDIKEGKHIEGARIQIKKKKQDYPSGTEETRQGTTMMMTTMTDGREETRGKEDEESPSFEQTRQVGTLIDQIKESLEESGEEKDTYVYGGIQIVNL